MRYGDTDVFSNHINGCTYEALGDLRRLAADRAKQGRGAIPRYEIKLLALRLARYAVLGELHDVRQFGCSELFALAVIRYPLIGVKAHPHWEPSAMQLGTGLPKLVATKAKWRDLACTVIREIYHGILYNLQEHGYCGVAALSPATRHLSLSSASSGKSRISSRGGRKRTGIATVQIEEAAPTQIQWVRGKLHPPHG